MAGQLLEIIQQFRKQVKGENVSPSRLDEMFDLLEEKAGQPQRQSLLYLQAANTSVASGLLGMSMVIDGEIDDGPPSSDHWPYHNVLDAIGDGWRVISFPNMALLAHDDRTYGLGCEFILEKWEC